MQQDFGNVAERFADAAEEHGDGEEVGALAFGEEELDGVGEPGEGEEGEEEDCGA